MLCFYTDDYTPNYMCLYFVLATASSPLLSTQYDSVGDLVHSYDSVLGKLADTYAATCTKNIVIKPSSPWYKTDIHMEKMKRRQLEKRFESSHSSEDSSLYEKQCHLVTMC